MTGLRVLFIGGTGIISAECVRRAVTLGHEVTVLNRGWETKRPLPTEVKAITADAQDEAAVMAALGEIHFDVVANFTAFVPSHVEQDLRMFGGKVGQYIFVSSASAYQTPPARLPITESTPLCNPVWQYSRDKIACEDLLVTVYREHGFPATIVRPSHTYDPSYIPTLGGWTDIARMREGKPVVVLGDGTNLWTITSSRDFAVGFVGLLGNPLAIGEAFHITGDHAPTWNQIYGWLGAAAGVEPELVHVASETITRVLPDQGPGLLGDKMHSMVFDNSKIKALVPKFCTTVPYWQGAAEQIAWFDAHPGAQLVDATLDTAFDRLITHARNI